MKFVNTHFGLVVALSVAVIGRAPAPAAARSGPRQEGAATLSYVLPSTAPVGSPVVLMAFLKNDSSAEVRFDLGVARRLNFRFELVTPSGNRQAGVPSPPEGISPSPWVAVGPASQADEALVLDRWLTLKEVGEYRLTIEFLGTVLAPPGVPVHLERRVEATVRMTPRDPTRIRQLCDDLVDTLVASPGRLALRNAEILGYFSDSAAFPCLKRVIDSDASLAGLVIEGYARAGGAAARAALNQLLAHPDAVVVGYAKFALARVR